MHLTQKVCVNPLFMLSVGPLVNSRLLVTTFWGSQKWYTDLLTAQGLAPITLTLGSAVFLYIQNRKMAILTVSNFLRPTLL